MAVLNRRRNDVPDASGIFTPAHCLGCRRLGDAAAGMFVEVQRADTKATTLCGVAGALLAVDAAALSSVPRSGWLSVTALACAAVLLGVALVVALSAIRPVVPRDGEFRVFAGSVPGQGGPEEVLSAFSGMSAGEHVRAEAERLVLFAGLAQRKFRAVKWAVDFTATAVAVAGIGLLSIYITA
ncbi:Pycsar system effector family protein [Streptomyces sp. NPDC002730]|uniref:Pycsar system effector family protein n=1 Tax=Streptomyces sp. NPDC002730 TaxID=3364662 RepID=UPI0036981B71